LSETSGLGFEQDVVRFSHGKGNVRIDGIVGIWKGELEIETVDWREAEEWGTRMETF
jgi:hypothetical protein